MTSPMLVALLVPIVALIAVFSFVSVAAWAEQRTKEREVFYRSEVYKKLAESSGEQAQQVLAMVRAEELAKEERRHEGRKLGGVIVTMVGIGLGVMLALVVPHEPVWSVGLIPLLIGVALLVYEYVLAPRRATRGNVGSEKLS
jgi:hypothetical protein